jgi:hypothetical protein
MLLHEVHNLLEALLFLNVETVAELLLVLPIIHHFARGLGSVRPSGRGSFECADARLIQDGTVSTV